MGAPHPAIAVELRGDALVTQSLVGPHVWCCSELPELVKAIIKPTSFSTPCMAYFGLVCLQLCRIPLV